MHSQCQELPFGSLGPGQRHSCVQISSDTHVGIPWRLSSSTPIVTFSKAVLVSHTFHCQFSAWPSFPARHVTLLALMAHLTQLSAWDHPWHLLSTWPYSSLHGTTLGTCSLPGHIALCMGPPLSPALYLAI